MHKPLGLRLGYALPLTTSRSFKIYVNDLGARQLRLASTVSQPLTKSVNGHSTASHGEHASSRTRSAAGEPLARLPLTNILRSYMLMSISSSPRLSNFLSSILRRMLSSKNPIMDVDRNPLLRWFLLRTFYAQFCAGDNQMEVRQVIHKMRDIGYSGVILEYGAELLEDGQTEDPAVVQRHIDVWREGLVETIQMADEGDFVGLKWSGMGPEALRLMKANEPPTSAMDRAMRDICDAASAKGVRLLPAAEPQNANRAVEDWTLALARDYNSAATTTTTSSSSNDAVVFCTYQAYLKHIPSRLAEHLKLAKQQGFVLGVKLVRGAYLGSETRKLIWDTKEDTDRCYNDLMRALLTHDVDALGVSSAEMPPTSLVIASHNRESVELAVQVCRGLRDSSAAPAPSAPSPVSVSYAQLQGMADEVSCELVQRKSTDDVAVYKCITWGSVRDCLNYLLRRAAENQDALSRTIDTKVAMGKEVRRRVRRVFSLS